MKSNDCSNQRLFGGLQIWRELRRCIERRPRLRTGQPVHRSWGAGRGSHRQTKAGGGEPQRRLLAQGAPRELSEVLPTRELPTEDGEGRVQERVTREIHPPLSPGQFPAAGAKREGRSS